MLYMLLAVTIKPLVWLLLRPKIYGKKENLRQKGKAIFICNHRTMFDPVILAIISPRVIHFMAKKELFSTKMGNIFFKSLLVFPVSRKSADIKSLKKAVELLNSGKVFGIFPEGRRSVTDDMDEFERGTAFIAIKSGAPIVPIYISPKSYQGSFRLKMMVGELIKPDEIAEQCNGRKLIDVITCRMKNALEELQFSLNQELSKPKMR